MATVVGILDRDSWSARTDNIVVADPVAKALIWIPRDLWCPALRDRINEAFALAGFAALLYALRELGIQCDYGVVLRRSATERAAAGISVEVPVDEPLNFLYPLAPTRPIEQGHKLISFRPPAECLEGERIHQWIGARMAEDRKGSDLDRIRRQQVFLRALLEQRFDFGSVVADANLVRISDGAALKELASVDSSWRMEALSDLRYESIDGKSVLIKRDEPLRR
jgi:anionic cell wall polymer biosynthesis LytR-Cps2A-Psr (LCP) family protein